MDKIRFGLLLHLEPFWLDKPYKCNTVLVVLFVLRVGVEFLCCLHLMYVVIFLVKFG